MLFTPLLGALVIFFIPREKAGMHRLVGNAFGLLGILVALPLIWKFNAAKAPHGFNLLAITAGFLRLAFDTRWGSTA